MSVATKSLTTHELDGRVTSMIQCAQSYPILWKNKPDELSVTTSLMDFYGMEVQQRYFNFIVRHHLLDKFTEEDDAGVR